MLRNTSTLDDLIKEINDLKLAKELLNRVWIELSPYSNVLSQQLNADLNLYMDFDDSE